MGQRIGHDLILEVERWEATVEVDEGGAVRALRLEADPRSLAVREGLHGVKPLSDRGRREIRKTIDQKVLTGRPIEFESTDIAQGLSVSGRLTMAGAEVVVTARLPTAPAAAAAP
ncbi:MAG TPA: hypothetical protein VG126_11940 [Thermoleophilaceae bacterium]|nr:hypothetical protein [Thermoleophilaceae bacterium]